jgi:hypothetical protein
VAFAWFLAWGKNSPAAPILLGKAKKARHFSRIREDDPADVSKDLRKWIVVFST